MKSLLAFSQSVLLDLGDRCGISTGRDFKTVTARVEHEGESFLTISLPQFGKDFEKSLDRGAVDRSVFSSFRRHGELPRFLGGFLDLVFDRKSGRLLDQPSYDAILSVRQFTLMFGKFQDVCSPARVEAAYDGFIKCEQEVRSSDAKLSQEDLSDFVRVSSVLFTELFTEMDRKVYFEELVPKHGPGKTAEYLSANGKYTQNEWTTRLESVFPFGENIFPNFGWYQSFDGVNLLEPRDERPVRVVAVPKTQKTPRLIAIEPACMQYMQQALFLEISGMIDRDELLSSILGTQSQEPNRLLAKEGSREGTLATLDLSEASDRVSNQHVRAMLQRWPHLHEAVDACRSRKADVPGYGEIRLAKFASMGSALCFPAESLVFTSLVFLGIERALNRRMTKRLAREMVGRVRVYGDDIIVPVDMVHSVISVLETFGLKVNADKSFWTGKFRESCGGDFYDGRWVTPIRMRKKLPASRKHVDEIVSTSALRNLLFEAGYVRAVEHLDDILEKLLPVYPEVPRDSPAIGRWVHGPVQGLQTHPTLYKPQFKACVKVDITPKDPLEDYGALMKWFLKRSDLPFHSRDHLLRAGRPDSSHIKVRWVTTDEVVTSS